MIRGTTAQFKFKLPYALNSLEWIIIKFWQPHNLNSSLPITKGKSDCSSSGNNEICVSLTVSETAIFSDKYKAMVQLAAKPLLGSPFGSKRQTFTVYPMLDSIISAEPNVPITPPSSTDDDWIILDGSSVVDE